MAPWKKKKKRCSFDAALDCWVHSDSQLFTFQSSCLSFQFSFLPFFLHPLFLFFLSAKKASKRSRTDEEKDEVKEETPRRKRSRKSVSSAAAAASASVEVTELTEESEQAELSLQTQNLTQIEQQQQDESDEDSILTSDDVERGIFLDHGQRRRGASLKRVGAHVSAAGGIDQAVFNARALGG